MNSADLRLPGLTAALLFLCIASCTRLGGTRLESVWQDEAFSRQAIRSVMILGIAEDTANRRLFEQSFADELSQRGIRAVPSHDLIPEIES